MNAEQLRRHLDEAHRQMLDRDNAFRHHEEELRHRDHEIEQLGIQVGQLREELSAAQEWARDLERSVREMETTRAWRLATRLRSLRSAASRMFRRGTRR